MTRTRLCIGACLTVALTCCADTDITLPSGDLTIRTDSLPHGIQGLPYTAFLDALGGRYPLSWSVSSGALPTGLQLTENGAVTGVPTTYGSDVVGVRVESADGQTADTTLAISVVARLAPDELCANHHPEAVATFADSLLATVIRGRIGDPATCARVSQITWLRATGGHARISSLVGMQNLLGLRELSLASIVAPATDLAPLGELTNLLRLEFYENPSVDIGPLSGLVNLTYLYLAENALTDISALSPLVELTHLGLNDNGVTDISALSGMVHLQYLFLDDNPLTDMQALLDNGGLGAGDQVGLRSTGVSCADVDVLSARGVAVLADCP